MNPARIRAYIYLLIVVIIWGIAPSVIKFALGELPPFTFLTYRYLITILIMLPIYLPSNDKGLSWKNLPLVTLISFLGASLTLGLLFYGTNLTTSLDSSLISAVTPIMVALVGVVLLKEHVTKIEKIGIAVTLIGTFLIASQSLFEGTRQIGESTIGNLIILASDVSFTGYLLLSKKALRDGVSALTITFMMFFVGFISTLPLVFLEFKPSEILPKIIHLSLSAELSVLFMAIFSGAIAYFLYQKAQKSIEASEAAVFTYLSPLVTAPVALLWLHEKLTSVYIVGSIIIAIGVILAEWKKRRYN